MNEREYVVNVTGNSDTVAIADCPKNAVKKVLGENCDIVLIKDNTKPSSIPIVAVRLKRGNMNRISYYGVIKA